MSLIPKVEGLGSDNLKRLRCEQLVIGRQLHNRNAQAIAELLSCS